MLFFSSSTKDCSRDLATLFYLCTIPSFDDLRQAGRFTRHHALPIVLGLCAIRGEVITHGCGFYEDNKLFFSCMAKLYFSHTINWYLTLC
jgi:hypothetical protein